MIKQDFLATSIDNTNDSTPEITLQVDSNGRILYQINHNRCSVFRTEDGEFGMSIQALTDVCCVSKKKVIYAIRRRTHQKFAPWLTPFAGDMILARQRLFQKNHTIILKLNFCNAVIDYFQNEQAKIAIPIIHKGYKCYQTNAGDIGMTKLDLAEACDVYLSSIYGLIKHTTHSSIAPWPWLQVFVGSDISLLRVWLKNGGQPKVLLKWDFCWAVINHYKNTSQKADRQYRVAN